MSEQRLTPVVRVCSHPTLTLRLSDGVNGASAPFTADSPAALAAGCAEALDDYCRQQRAAWDAGPRAIHRDSAGERVVLHLQVMGRDGHGYLPMKPPIPADAPYSGPAMLVEVGRRILERRPPDDWSDIWAWCVQSDAWGRAIGGLAHQAASLIAPPIELTDTDRRTDAI